MNRIPLVIRAATIDDIDALVELATTTFRETYQLGEDPAEMDEYVAREFTREGFAAILGDTASSMLLALEGQRSIGYMHLRQSSPPPCVTGAAPVELSRMYLRQDAIGKGYGTDLMKATLQTAGRGNFNTIWLVVYSRNEHARNFYRRWGFSDVGIKDFMFGGRAYPDPVMARAIEPPASL